MTPQKQMLKNYGYIPDVIAPEDYVFGGSNIPDEILQPNGQWGVLLPKDEFQFNESLDTQNCSNYGTLNPIETIMKRKFEGEYDYSERYLGVMSGTTEQGNSPHKVAETIRKESGLVPESMLPFDRGIRTWQQYYNPNPMIEPYLSEGKKWLSNYLLLHEWVFTDNNSNKVELIKEALKRSPLGISVYAWMYGEDCYIKPKGAKDNHWVCLYGYEEGKYWLIFDQYDSTRKKLAWDYDFNCAKRYYIAKRLSNEEIKEKLSLIQQAINKLSELISKLFPKFGRKQKS
jgi:hypothetical protein